MPRHDLSNRPRDCCDLLRCNRIGNPHDRLLVEQLAVRTNDSRHALTGIFARGRTTVRRRHGVVLGRQSPTPEVHVADERERFGRDTGHAVPIRRGPNNRFHRRSKRARIDQLAGGETVGIAPARRDDRTIDDRNDVGGRGADIDQKRGPVTLGNEPRRGSPVRRSHSQRSLARLVHRQERAIGREHANVRVGERGADRVEHKRNAVTLGAKHLRELRGHRHRADERLGCRDTELGGHLAQHADEGVRIPLQLERTRAHRHRAVVKTRDLGVHARQCPSQESPVLLTSWRAHSVLPEPSPQTTMPHGCPPGRRRSLRRR